MIGTYNLKPWLLILIKYLNIMEDTWKKMMGKAAIMSKKLIKFTQIQEGFGQCPQAPGRIFKVSWAGPGAGVDDFDRSLST